MAKSLDFGQIELDVARCTWHLLTGTQRTVSLQMEHKRHRKVARLIRRKQRRLANLINITLVQSYKSFSGSNIKSNSSQGAAVVVVEKDNTLRYYQGYHDVACIILSTLSGCSPVRLRPSEQFFTSMEGAAAATGLDMPAAVLLQVSQSHLRDSMRANFLQLQTALRLTILPLLAYFDREVHDRLADCEMQPFFALSWVITWFSHEIRDTELVKRLFDFFLVSHPLMPIYVSVAMVCHPLNRQELLHTECEFSELHQALAALPKNSSMVGWKYRPGDGYVSDDEEDDDLSVEMMDSQSSVDTDFLLHEEALQSIRGCVEGVRTAEAVSTVSSAVSSMNEARVPFEEILEHAVSYMERLPPRKMLGLSARYYGRDQVQELVEGAPGISFLQTPPGWTRAPRAKSDWVLRQEDRQQRGLGPSRRDRKVVEQQQQEEEQRRVKEVCNLDVEDDEDRKRILADDKSKALAILAAGYGAGDDVERRRRRQRRGMMVGAVVVAALAISVGLGIQWSRRRQTSTTAASLGEALSFPSGTVADSGAKTETFKVMATSGQEPTPPSPPVMEKLRDTVFPEGRHESSHTALQVLEQQKARTVSPAVISVVVHQVTRRLQQILRNVILKPLTRTIAAIERLHAAVDAAIASANVANRELRQRKLDDDKANKMKKEL